MENEKRLIYAEDLKKIALKQGRTVRLDRYTGRWPCLLLADIKLAPTVDAVEVVHGRWELQGNDDDCGCSYFCSNCLASYDEDWFYVHGQYRYWNYCPNCGAKMDGE